MVGKIFFKEPCVARAAGGERVRPPGVRDRRRRMEITLPAAELDIVLRHPLVQALLECSSDGAVVIDARTRKVVAMNGRAQQLLGREGKDAVGCECHEALNSPACQHACPLTLAEAGQSVPDSVALFYRSQDAEVVHATARMLIVRDLQGAPIAGIELFQDQREIRALERALRSRRSLHALVGRSDAMQTLYDRVEEVAPCDSPVLVQGEAGTGKRRVAEALHACSPRADRALVSIAADSLPAERLAPALQAALDDAAGGTLLLCRVDEAPAELCTLLDGLVGSGGAVLQGSRLHAADVRLVLTARRAEALPARLRQRFEDVTITVPPLRRRVEDIPLLAEQLLREHQLDPLPWDSGVLAALAGHRWPGNITELGTCLRAARLRAAGPRLQVADLHLESTGPVETLADLEAQAIARAMAAAQGNLSAAARLLGIDRSTLWRKLKRADQQAQSPQ